MLPQTLKKLRKQKGVTQAGLAKAMQVTQQAVGKWETGRASPDPAMLMSLAEYFEVSTDALLGRAGAHIGQVMPYKTAELAAVPVLGTVKAGYGALAYEEDFGTELANVKDPENYFYLVVKGDSMEPRIQNGDLALVRRQNNLEDGDLGVVVYGEGEGTLKRFMHKGNAIILQPFNPQYETVVLAGNELENLYIAGKVVETKARW